MIKKITESEFAQRSWLTVAEVAVLLKAHPQTVYEWIDKGLLQAARIGRHFIRINRTALERSLEDQAKGNFPKRNIFSSGKSGNRVKG